MDLFGKSPRPRLNKEIIKPVITSIAKDIQKWLNDGSDLDDIQNDIEEIILDDYYSDGYSLAKKMEDDLMYCSDSELVDILDAVDYRRNNALQSAIKNWVKTDDIQPKLNVGDKVEVSYRNKTYTGEIAKINTEYATYTVFIEILGHVREGIGTHGIIYNFEELEKQTNTKSV